MFETAPLSFSCFLTFSADTVLNPHMDSLSSLSVCVWQAVLRVSSVEREGVSREKELGTGFHPIILLADIA